MSPVFWSGVPGWSSRSAGRRAAGSTGGAKRLEDVPGFPVTVQNILGAGDAFGAGFLYGYVKGWDLRKAARLGNACGAMVVTRHGCSVSMPFWDEVMAFADERGGL